jgi:glycosyltransferase involved in cell wall biosynthesis
MKILIASDLHAPTVNGIATFGHNLATGLASRGHEVIVVAPSQNGKKHVEEAGNHKIARTSSVIFPFYQNLRVSLSPGREINQITKSFAPDVIHLQTPLGVGMGAIGAAKKYKIPLVATNHAMSENLIDNLKLLAPFAKQIDYILREYGHRFYSNADFVTLPTMAAITMLKPEKFSKPYAAISNGIDLSRFTPGVVTKKFYERYGIPSDVPIVMYLGRIDSEKHVSVLMLAAHQLMQEHLPMHLVIVGSGNDSAHLAEMTRDLGMVNNVTFTGRIEEADKPMMMRIAKVFVMPSPAELQSIATLEAMASGVPVVAVNAGALYELCIDGRNGYLFALDNDVEAANGIRKLLTDPKSYNRMVDQSLAIAQTHDLNHTLDEFEALYEKVIMARMSSPRQLTTAG